MPTGYSLYTVTFKDVSAETFDLQGIQVYKLDGTILGTSAEVTLEALTSTGGYDTNQYYNWRTRSGFTGWHKSATALKDDKAVKIGKAVGFCVYNKSGAAVKFRMSGEVELNPVTDKIPVGYTIFGNMTPATIDLQDLQVYKEDGETILGTSAEVTIEALTSTGGYDTNQYYNWRTRSGFTGWHKSATALKDDKAVSVAPGEAFCVYNKSGAPVIFKFKSPVSK